MKHGAKSSTSRAEVHGHWADLEAGRRTRSEISRWAEARLEDGTVDEELVIQGLLFLQTVDLVAAERRGEATPIHVDQSDDRFLLTDTDISRAFQSWQDELSRFDANPDAWMRRYMQHMVRDFAVKPGSEDARAFADKLVAHGELTAQDAVNALESAGGPSNEG